MRSLSKYIFEGSWGYDPMDSDQYHDNLDTFVKSNVTKSLDDLYTQKKNKDTSYGSEIWTVIGIYEFFIFNLYMKDYELTYDLERSDLVANLESMIDMCDNDEFKKAWDNKDNIDVAIKTRRSNLDKIKEFVKNKDKHKFDR